MYNNDEIDLIVLFKMFWDGKINILLITIISFLIGYGYTSLTSNNYLNSLTVKKSDDYEFIGYDTIAQLINDEKIIIKNNIKTNQLIFNKFIYEVRDFDEF